MIRRRMTQKTMTKFEKVSLEQYRKDCDGDWMQMSLFDEIEQEYNDIKIPSRSTKYSAGYDFYAPRTVTIMPGGSAVFHSGIRAIMPNDMFLALYARSGLGIKHRVTLANSTGIVDADYSGAANEGHIIFKLVNDGPNPVRIDKGKAFAQGIFQKYYTVDDDDTPGIRTGGLGSTDAAK